MTHSGKLLYIGDLIISLHVGYTSNIADIYLLTTRLYSDDRTSWTPMVIYKFRFTNDRRSRCTIIRRSTIMIILTSRSTNDRRSRSTIIRRSRCIRNSIGTYYILSSIYYTTKYDVSEGAECHLN